jgi:DNA-binding MarR family transcriptional regulator
MGWRGLTLVHVQFLSEVDEEGSMLSDIAMAMRTTKQYAGRLAKESADKGLISIQDNPNDRRAVLVRPTDRGRTFLEDACAVRRQLEDAFFEGADVGRRQAFLATLDAMLRSQRDA